MSSDQSSNQSEHEQLATLTSLLNNYSAPKKPKKKISLYRRQSSAEQSDTETNHQHQANYQDGSGSSDQENDSFEENSFAARESEQSSRSHISIDQRAMPEVINHPDDLKTSPPPENSRHSNILIDSNSEFSNIDLPDTLPEINIPPPPAHSPEDPQMPHHHVPDSHPPTTQSPTTQHHAQHHTQSQPTTHSNTQPTVNHQQFRVQRKSVPGQNYGISPLTIITYNIWSNRRSQTGRTRELIKQLTQAHKYAPDLICLQEVTPKSYQILSQALEKDYFLFEILGQPPEQIPYSNLIGINRKTLEIINDTLTAYDFNSQMGRKLMVCQVKHRQTDVSFYILNAHLESFEENWSYRRDQMESINRLIKEEKIRNFILVGDFNICKSNEPVESKLRLSDYSDAWYQMGSPSSLKFTYDTEANRYAREKTETQPAHTKQSNPTTQSRLDRILYRFKDSKIVATKLKLLGVREPHPSDHFGLLVEFMLKSN